MVLRNRLLSLLLRLTFFVLYVVAIGPYIAQYDSVWLALCTFNVEMMFLMSIMMGFEIIFNFIDLVRHGMRGASAGPYMPFALPLTAFSIASGIFYFTSMLPRDAAPSGTFGIMFNVLLIIIPLLDYLLIDEKGTVSFSAVLVWQVYPILFHVFGYFRTLIWPDSGIYNGYMYALPFLNYSGPYIFWWSLMFFATTLGGGALLVVFGNILSGRYRNYDLRAD